MTPHAVSRQPRPNSAGGVTTPRLHPCATSSTSRDQSCRSPNAAAVQRGGRDIAKRASASKAGSPLVASRTEQTETKEEKRRARRGGRFATASTHASYKCLAITPQP